MSSSNARLTLSAHREGQFSEIALKNSDLQNRVEKQQESLSSDSTKSYIPMQFYRQSHIVPFKRELKPYISMAPAPRTYTTSNDTFDIEYSETFIGPIAVKIKISSGQINPNDVTNNKGAYFAWSLPIGFACAILKNVTMSSHNEEIMKFDGKALYAVTMLDIDVRRLPALKALWKEAHVEWKYAPGVPTDFLADGVTEVPSGTNAGDFQSYDAANATYFKKYSAFEARMSYIPLQAPRFYRPEFYIYVPLDVLPMNRSLYYAFPHIAVHDLKVQIKVECNTVMDFVNVYASDARLGFTNDIVDDGTTGGVSFIDDDKVVQTATGFAINGDYVHPDEITWVSKPAILSKELYVTFYAVQAYLENALSVYRYTQIFPDITQNKFHITGPMREPIAFSGNYSHIALMPNYTHFNTRSYKKATTGFPTQVKSDAATITLGDTVAGDDGTTGANSGIVSTGGKVGYVVFPIDPFHEFLEAAPINNLTISPRSSEASVTYDWTELSLLQPYLMSLGDANCNPPNKNNMAIISFNALLDREKIINFYPLGIAPNLDIQIASTIFNTDMPGVVEVILMKFSEVIIWLNSCVKRFN